MGSTDRLRLAVIDHLGNPGGGSRVVRGLLHGFTSSPGLDITYFGSPSAIEREGLCKEFEPLGVKIAPLRALASGGIAVRLLKSAARRTIQRYQAAAKLIPLRLQNNVMSEIEQRVRGFDLAYFPWPYLLDCPDLDCPIVCTVHDLNFKYFFGVDVYNEAQLAQLELQLPRWLDRCTPVVSTKFIASEVKKFYPEHAGKLRVIHLAPPSTVSNIRIVEAKQRVSKLGIDAPYILYPTHNCSHKNINVLVSAMSLLATAGRELILVLTGNMGRFSGRATAIGLERHADGANVRSLGYVSNEDMDSLIQCATAVVSPSLYEAGNGPGLDAWARGVPVVMSAIPAFLEHIEVQGVKAKTFNPMDPREVAVRISEVLDQPEQARVDAEESRTALSRYSWDGVARQYRDVFSSLVRR